MSLCLTQNDCSLQKSICIQEQLQHFQVSFLLITVTITQYVQLICTEAYSHGNILLLRHMSVGDRFPRVIGFSQDFRSEITGV